MSRRKAAREASAASLDLDGRSRALLDVLESGGHRIGAADARRARTLLSQITDRQRLSAGSTVVALAGATGSGKSSLFNALTGLELATVGARRPTTSAALACVWGADGATQLLDWLDVPRQHRVSQESALGPADDRLHGLVLVDLPDFDSTELDHRLEVERLLQLVDVFVWVADPQKYADAALHRRYLAPLAGHDAVTVVVLNQVDRLDQVAAEACARDLQRLVRVDGLTEVEVLTTSAATGAGVDELRDRLAEAVRRRTAWAERLAADLDTLSGELRSQVADGERAPDQLDDGPLVDALTRAAGVPVVVDAVAEAYRRDARAAAGWPFTRWVQRLRPDPLRRLRLRGSAGPGRAAPAGAAAPGRSAASGRGPTPDQRTDPVLVRSSLPAASAGQLAQVRVATHDLAERASDGLPRAWADAVRAAAQVPVEDLRDAADQAVVSTDLEPGRPRWWSVAGAVQLAAAVVALVGLVWLVGLGVTGWLRLPEPPTPSWGRVPVPTLMLVGGLVIGLLLDVVVRALARSGARRRAARVEQRLLGAVAEVVRRRVLEPVGLVLQDHRATREALDRLGG